MAQGHDGSINIDTKIDTGGFNKGISAIVAQFGKIKSVVAGLAAAIGVTFGIQQVVDFGKTAVDAASQLASAMTGLQSVVQGQGKSFADAKNFINGYISDGLVPATNAIGAYKNLLMRGYSTEQIEKVMTALKDSASFGRQASLTLGQAVQSATEGLKNENSILVDNAGVTKNVAQMWKEYAASIGTTADKLTKAQKIQAEINGIMEESKYQTGDAAKLAGGYAGKVAALGVSFTNLQVAIGNSIIPVISQIIPYIKTLLDWLTVLANAASQYVQAFFGYDPSATVAAQEKVADSTQGAADAQGNLADQTKAAGKAAKGALAAFDELNVLQTPKDDKKAEDIKTPKMADAAAKPDAAFEAIKAKVEKFKEDLMNFFAPLQEPLARLGESFLKLGKTISEGLGWAWENILKPVGVWFAQEALPRIVEMWSNQISIFNSVLKELQPAALWLWENFLKPVGEWTGGAIIGFFDWFIEGQKRIQKALDEGGLGAAFLASWEYSFETIGIRAGELWSSLVSLFDPAAQWFMDNVITPLGDFFAWVWSEIQTKAGDAWNFVSQAWNGAGEWFKTTVTDPIASFFSGAWENIKKAVSDAWQSLATTWEPAGTWFETNVTGPISDIFTKLRDLLGILANNAWAVVVWAWNKAADWFKATVTDPLSKWFSEMWEKIKKFASDAWDKVASVWEDVSEWVKANVTDPVSRWFSEAWAGVGKWASDAWNKVLEVWGKASEWFKNTVTDPIQKWFSESWDGVTRVWKAAGDWITKNVTDPVKTAFKSVLDWIGNKWESVFGGIKDFVKDCFNGIIDMLNGLVSGVAKGINGMVGGLNGFGEQVPGWQRIPTVTAPKIPRLATGAVIPPNAEFAAILGDQKSGTNIEAPAELIRKIVREEIGGASSNLTVSMPVYLDGQKIYQNQKRVEWRRGNSLITGGSIA